MKIQIRKILPESIAAVILIALSAYLLGGDVWTFWTWWLLALFMGMVAMPVTGRLFEGFEDKGWLFSKALAIAVTGFLTWFLVAVKLLPFTAATCIGVSVICGIFCAILFHVQLKKGIECYPSGKIQLIVREELLFFGIFLLWTYLAGFRPQAYGTEKFMDYGFMEAMMRSKTLPARDLWYSQGTINYYYGGQYFAVFLTKLTGSRVEVTYNLMRTFVAAFAFVYPFSLVRQMAKDRLYGRMSGIKKYLPSLAGVTGGIAVSIAGNVHYIVYRCVLPLIHKIQGVAETASYWFPDATRYIGYNPVNESDKTIHEFPCYSFVLGDLHAHVVNVMFVLFLVEGFWLAFHAENRYCTLVGIGIMAQIAWQVFCNIAVVTNTLPNTGISLPFFSSGGTSLILLLAEMGVMVNIGRNGERARLEREEAHAERERQRKAKTIVLDTARRAQTEQ